MPHLEAIAKNTHLMIVEVTAQVLQTKQFLAAPGRELLSKIISRDDYIDNLKSLVEDRCFQVLSDQPSPDKSLVNTLRSAIPIAANLERIADFSVNIVRQYEHLEEPAILGAYNLEPFFQEVLLGLKRVTEAINGRQADLAYRICQCEFNLDSLYGDRFALIRNKLSAGEKTGDLVTTLFILHYLERMGDSLLNIGEAILFAIVGERMKIHQYRALTDSLAAGGLVDSIRQIEFESIWGTRSGCRIGTISEKGDSGSDPARPVVFKQGSLAKLNRERESIERWQRIIPGLAPQVRTFLPGDEDQAAILLEFLPGCTYQELLVNGDQTLAEDTTFILEEQLGQIYRATRAEKPALTDFVGQIRSRLDSVYRIHPQLRTPSALIGDLQVPSFEELLVRIEALEAELTAPFSVLTHGDMNLNNIIYNPDRERVHFIDLHRSQETDYVQDISVLQVSAFRLPIFDANIRRRLNETALHFLDFARRFAAENEDRTMEARLALALGRSFCTSTRFELNHKFAQKMYQRSTYIFEKLLAHGGAPWSEFRLPKDVLIH